MKGRRWIGCNLQRGFKADRARGRSSLGTRVLPGRTDPPSYLARTTIRVGGLAAMAAARKSAVSATAVVAQVAASA